MGADFVVGLEYDEAEALVQLVDQHIAMVEGGLLDWDHMVQHARDDIVRAMEQQL